MDDIGLLANIIYGEAANQKPEVMEMVGSTVLNRLASGRSTEFGSNIDEIGRKGYYAVINENEPYKQAVTGKFKDEVAREAYKKAYAIASGLYKGTIPIKEGQFFFKDKEKPKMNWKLLKESGVVGPYKVWSYK